MSNDKPQTKTRKANKLLQNLTREDINQFQINTSSYVDSRGLRDDYGSTSTSFLQSAPSENIPLEYRDGTAALRSFLSSSHIFFLLSL
jgi:hypothetical protein